MELVKREKIAQEKLDGYVLAMWLMFLRAPRRATGPGETVDLGEIGEVKMIDQRLRRETPYSICGGRR